MPEGTQPPQIPCCQCGVVMHVYLQPGTDVDEAAYFVTCVNNTCVMWGQTLSANHYPPENLQVYLYPNERDAVIIVYIDLVRQESQEAAAAIEHIHATISAQAALRAAVIITIFRMEIKQNHWIPDMRIYAYLIRDYQHAIPLLEYAMACCLRAWGIHDFESAHIKIGDLANSDANTGSSMERD